MVYNEGEASRYSPAGWLGSLARRMLEGMLSVVKPIRAENGLELAQMDLGSVAYNTTVAIEPVASPGSDAAAQHVAPLTSSALCPCSTSVNSQTPGAGPDTEEQKYCSCVTPTQGTLVHQQAQQYEHEKQQQFHQAEGSVTPPLSQQLNKQQHSQVTGPIGSPDNSISAASERGPAVMSKPAPAGLSYAGSSSPSCAGPYEGQSKVVRMGQVAAVSAAARAGSETTSQQAPKLPRSGCPQLDKYLSYLLGEAHPHSFMYYPSWGMPDSACAAVGEFLRRDKRIKVMTLANNSIQDGGCELIAEGLAVNRTLITLDLSKNKISDMGALALAEALHTNTTLKELQLNGNSIGDEGAEALAAAVATNSTLKKLNIAGNPMSAAQKQVVEQALKTRVYRMLNKQPSVAKSWARLLHRTATPSSVKSDIELTDSEEVVRASERLKLPPSQAIAALAEPASTLEASLADQVSSLIKELKTAEHLGDSGASSPSAERITAQPSPTNSSAHLILMLGLRLAWRGYEVVIRTSSKGAGDVADGSVSDLQHTSLRVVQPGPDAGLEPGVIIDPCFRDQFRTCPQTERYQSILAALPSVLVMAEHRLYHLVDAVSSEMMQAGHDTGTNSMSSRDDGTLLDKWLCKEPTDMLVDPHATLESLQLMVADHTAKQQG